MEAADEMRQKERITTEDGREIIIAMNVDVEDKPSNRHNAVVQTTQGCCYDVETIVFTVDRYILTTMNDGERG